MPLHSERRARTFLEKKKSGTTEDCCRSSIARLRATILHALVTGAAYYGIAAATIASFRLITYAIAIVLTIECAPFLNISDIIVFGKRDMRV